MTREQLVKHWDVIQAFKDGKQLQCRTNSGWILATAPSFDLDTEYLVKPTQTKRPPTIQEVEKWFLDNKVFIYKNTGIFERIEAFDRKTINNVYFGDNSNWRTILEFCELFTHLDGSELYITEN